MEPIIVIVVCLIIAGFVFRTAMGHEAEEMAKEAPGRYWGAIGILAVLAFFVLVLLGTCTSR